MPSNKPEDGPFSDRWPLDVRVAQRMHKEGAGLKKISKATGLYDDTIRRAIGDTLPGSIQGDPVWGRLKPPGTKR